MVLSNTLSISAAFTASELTQSRKILPTIRSGCGSMTGW